MPPLSMPPDYYAEVQKKALQRAIPPPMPPTIGPNDVGAPPPRLLGPPVAGGIPGPVMAPPPAPLGVPGRVRPPVALGGPPAGVPGPGGLGIRPPIQPRPINQYQQFAAAQQAEVQRRAMQLKGRSAPPRPRTRPRLLGPPARVGGPPIPPSPRSHYDTGMPLPPAY